MTEVIELDSARNGRAGSGNPHGRVLFSRPELRQLLGFYTTRVMSGEWRDYALDFLPRGAMFSVYRHAADRPLFSITKLAPGRDRRHYVLTAGPAVLKRARQLADLLALLDAKPRLVWSRG
jgi:hypothetical protein